MLSHNGSKPDARRRIVCRAFFACASGFNRSVFSCRSPERKTQVVCASITAAIYSARLQTWRTLKTHFKTCLCLAELVRRASEGWTFEDGEALTGASGWF